MSNNCDAGNQVTEYDLGSYSFVFVEDNNGGKLYFENGTFYCASAPGYDCVALYGLNNPTANWVCRNPGENCMVDDPFSLAWLQNIVSVDTELGIPGIFRYENEPYPVGVTRIWQFEFEDDTYFMAQFGVIGPLIDAVGYAIFDCAGNVHCYIGSVLEPNSETVCQYVDYYETMDKLIWVFPNPNNIFTNYPWLNTLVNPNNCEGASIQVYTNGSFEFISIEDNEGTNLYFQDGTFYCADGPNYSCTQLYGLETAENEWTCEGANRKQAISLFEKTPQQKIGFDVDFKAYPNPSNGQFTVEFNDQNKEAGELNIISLEGKLLYTKAVESNQKLVNIHLAGLTKGIYIIQLQTQKITKSQRIIIQ